MISDFVVAHTSTNVAAESSQAAMEEANSKTCTKCFRRKPLEEYAAFRGGRTKWCDGCRAKEHNRRTRKRKRERDDNDCRDDDVNDVLVQVFSFLRNVVEADANGFKIYHVAGCLQHDPSVAVPSGMDRISSDAGIAGGIYAQSADACDMDGALNRQDIAGHGTALTAVINHSVSADAHYEEGDVQFCRQCGHSYPVSDFKHRRTGVPTLCCEKCRDKSYTRVKNTRQNQRDASGLQKRNRSEAMPNKRRKSKEVSPFSSQNAIWWTLLTFRNPARGVRF